MSSARAHFPPMNSWLWRIRDNGTENNRTEKRYLEHLPCVITPQEILVRHLALAAKRPNHLDRVAGGERLDLGDRARHAALQPASHGGAILRLPGGVCQPGFG